MLQAVQLCARFEINVAGETKVYKENIDKKLLLPVYLDAYTHL